MKTKKLLSLALIFSAFCVNVMAVVDTFEYPARNGSDDDDYTLTSKWFFSAKGGNYDAGSALAADGMIRCMVEKDGNLLFADRTNHEILVINGQTGQTVKRIKLADSWRDYAPTGTFHLNCIKKDAKGNVLIANLTTDALQTFRVGKVNLTTGAVDVIVNCRIEDFFPGALNRFDLFGVYGDVDTDAVIYASTSQHDAISLKGNCVYRWKVHAGIAGEPEWIPAILTEKGFASNGGGLASNSWGFASNIFPMGEDVFYVSAQGIYPTLFQVVANDDDDLEARVVDAFYDLSKENTPIISAYYDEITEPGKKHGMNTTYSSLAKFKIGDEYFLVLPAYNYVDPGDTNPEKVLSNFRLFKFRDADQRFAEMEVLWTFPIGGFGKITNNISYSTDIAVSVSANVATIYLYVNQAGYAAYEFTAPKKNSVKNLSISGLTISGADKAIQFSEAVASAQVFSVTGQLIAKGDGASIAVSPGIYVVKAIALNGEAVVAKVVVE